MQYPIFIPTKGRHDIQRSSSTADLLDRIGVPYTLIVEEKERDLYAKRWGTQSVVVLPVSYQEEYDTCDDYGSRFPVGAGAARNFAWDLARDSGSAWHWTLDDNINTFLRVVRGKRVSIRQLGDDGLQFFSEAESMITRWKNVAMGGLHARTFVIPSTKTQGAIKNTRIYSCNLIRTVAPFRWRARYNEDTVLSLDMLTSRWATLLLNRWLMNKAATQTVKGGNTDAIYVHGTGTKSRQLQRIYPDYVKLVIRFGRYHHRVDYRKHFGHIPLIADSCFDYPPVDFSKHFGYLPGVQQFDKVV